MSLEEISSSLQYDWLYSRDLLDRTWIAKAGGEDDYLQMVAFLLDASLRTHIAGARTPERLADVERYALVSCKQRLRKGCFLYGLP